MISEQQAEALLLECEKSVGYPLTVLRKRLANQKDAYATLWELIVLYCCLPLGSITHESEVKNCPDIHIVVSGKHSLWIEAAYIHSRMNLKKDNATDFLKWILLKLQAEGISCARNANIEILLKDKSKVLDIPEKNRWFQLLKDSSWRLFAKNARDSNCIKGDWICPLSNIIIRLHGTSESGKVCFKLPPFKELQSPEQHLVYKEVKKKAEQAKKWHYLGKSYQPLVLCIGALENTSEINLGTSNRVSLYKSVYSALQGVKNMSLAEQINITGKIDSKKAKKFRVSGSKLISAVIVVTLETRTQLFTPDFYKVPKVSIFPNPEAGRLLTQEELDLLNQINFNLIKWGPGWEAWQVPRGVKRKDNRNIDRLRRQGGRITMRYLSNGAFEIELPVSVIARLLAGDMSHEDIDELYNEDITKLLKGAVHEGQQIVGCKYIAADSKSRNHGKILFRYSSPQPIVISDPDKRKDKFKSE